jgi:hypothetical protein
MKHLIILIPFFFLGRPLLFAQSGNEFVIGVDLFNMYNGNYPPPSTQDWLNLKDLGIKYAGVTYNDDWTLTTNQIALATLDIAENYGVKLLLNRYNCYSCGGFWRWQYHPE